MRTSGWLAGAVALMLTLDGADAAPIEYDFLGTGSIQLFNGPDRNSPPGSAYSGQFTLRLVGDTSGIYESSGIYYNPVTTTITVGTFSATFTGYTAAVAYQVSGTPGVEFLQEQGNQVQVGFIGVGSPLLTNYMLGLSSPIIATSNSFQFSNFQTDAGSFLLNGVSPDLIFIATTVPAVLGTPGPIAGAGLVPLLGLVGAYLFGRKRLAA